MESRYKNIRLKISAEVKSIIGLLTWFILSLTKLSIQLALSGFAEFTLHLTRLGPEMLQIARDSGRLTVSYSRFEVDDSKGMVCGVRDSVSF